MTKRKPIVRRSKARDDKFIEFLLEGLGPKRSAVEAGYSVAAVYVRRHKDPDFNKRWSEADEVGIQVQLAALETECDRRAIDGVLHNVVTLDKKDIKIMKYSDSLLMFRMKKLDPTYRDKVDLNHTGTVNNVMVVPSCSSVDDWEKQSQKQHSESLGE